MRKRSNLFNCFIGFVSTFLVFFAVICVCMRVPSFIKNNDAMLASAYLTMPDGELKKNEKESIEPQEVTKITKTEITQQEEATQPAAEKAEDVDKTHEGMEQYPVIESHFTYDDKTYDNFNVRNTTNYALDYENLLSSELGFQFEDTREVQVLIIHTHTSETYLDYDTGYYYEDFYPRTTDDSKNITQVGEAIARSLKENNIGVVHDTTHHDDTYTGSYDRSYDTTMKYLKKYPNIKVILDIHRDSITYDDNSKVKPTFTYDGKKGAQIMIMTGYDEDGSYNYPDWNYNLRFALRLQQTTEDMYPGMTRPLYFGDFVYNMNINSGSLLIEVGTDSNTLDEAIYSGELLGKALSKVLQNQ